MNYTYFIMDDHFIKASESKSLTGLDKYYVLGKQGVDILKERTYSDAERAFIEANRSKLETMHFAHNMVYIMKQACGHYEIFQTHVSSKVEGHLEEAAILWLDAMAIDAKTRKCTRCTCNW